MRAWLAAFIQMPQGSVQRIVPADGETERDRGDRCPFLELRVAISITPFIFLSLKRGETLAVSQKKVRFRLKISGCQMGMFSPKVISFFLPMEAGR